jgi:hypothetical protein
MLLCFITQTQRVGPGNFEFEPAPTLTYLDISTPTSRPPCSHLTLSTNHECHFMTMNLLLQDQLCSLQVAPNHGLAVYVARRSPHVPEAQLKIIDDAVSKGVIPVVNDSPTVFLDFIRGASNKVLDEFVDATKWGLKNWNRLQSDEVCWCFFFHSCRTLALV